MEEEGVESAAKHDTADVDDRTATNHDLEDVRDDPSIRGDSETVVSDPASTRDIGDSSVSTTLITTHVVPDSQPVYA